MPTDDPELVGLAEISWGDLRHAYGSAEDLPRLLSGLFNAESAGQCLDELFTNIWHQGSVYSATAPAVFILEQAACNETIDASVRAGIVFLLYQVEQGSGWYHAHRSFLEERGRIPSDIDERLAAEDQFIEAAVTACSRAARFIIECTRDSQQPQSFWCALGALAACATPPVPELGIVLRRLDATEDPRLGVAAQMFHERAANGTISAATVDSAVRASERIAFEVDQIRLDETLASVNTDFILGLLVEDVMRDAWPTRRTTSGG